MKKVIAVLMSIAILLGGCGTAKKPVTGGGFEESPMKVVEIQIEQAPETIRNLFEQQKFNEISTVVEEGNYVYVLLTMGEQPTSGYEISFISVSEANNKYQVSYEWIVPQPNSVGLQVITYPYLLLQLPKTENEIIFLKHKNEEVEPTSNMITEPQVGDKYAGMEITEAIVSKEPSYTAAISFKNETTVTGSFQYDPDHEFIDGIMFRVAEESLASIPKLANDDRYVWFGFTNEEVAKQLLGVTDGVAIEGEATIIIDLYEIHYAPTEIWNLATIVDVIK